MQDIVLELGTVLEEISIEDLNKENVSAIILTNSSDAIQILEKSGMQYDGTIDMSGIEFCKIEAFQDYLLGTLCIPKLSNVPGEEFHIMFFVGQRHIVIIDDDGFAKKIISRIKQCRVKQGHSKEIFLYNFFTAFMGKDIEYLGRYEKSIMHLEEEVDSDHTDDFREKITPIRKELLILREYYDELHDMAKEFEENENQFFTKKNLRFFGIIADRADRLLGRASHLLAYAGQVYESYIEQKAEKQNQNMEFLTIISTIFFPLTLITGWYGMNFENMPELKCGYPGVIVLSIIVVFIIFYIFKKKKIL